MNWTINHVPNRIDIPFTNDLKTVFVEAPDMEGAWDLFLALYQHRLILSTYPTDPLYP